MKWILENVTILFISVLICLFAGCGGHTPHELESVPPVEPQQKFIESRAPQQKFVEPRVLQQVSTRTITQDWTTYKAAREAEGYTLLGVPESAIWLKVREPDITLDISSNSQYNLRTVVTLTTTYTIQTGVRVVTVLIVNDDQGNMRVFE